MARLLLSSQRRLEGLVREGGFAVITGDPGTGKSVALLPRPSPRRAARRHHRHLTRPQSGLGDFYREMGQLFGLALAPHNRWGGFKILRETSLAHVEATRCRPVLLVDEAQEMPDAVLAELGILAATGGLLSPGLVAPHLGARTDGARWFTLPAAAQALPR